MIEPRSSESRAASTRFGIGAILFAVGVVLIGLDVGSRAVRWGVVPVVLLAAAGLMFSGLLVGRRRPPS